MRMDSLFKCNRPVPLPFSYEDILSFPERLLKPKGPAVWASGALHLTASRLHSGAVSDFASASLPAPSTLF